MKEIARDNGMEEPWEIEIYYGRQGYKSDTHIEPGSYVWGVWSQSCVTTGNIEGVFIDVDTGKVIGKKTSSSTCLEELLSAEEPKIDMVKSDKEVSFFQRIINKIRSFFGFGDSKEPELSPPKYCNTVDDCVVISHCCGCNAGGKREAFNREWYSQNVLECGIPQCLQSHSTHISCFSELECVNNTCSLVATKERLCSYYWACNLLSPKEVEAHERNKGVLCEELRQICEDGQET